MSRKISYFYYLDGDGRGFCTMIRISAALRPGANTKPTSTTWVVQEFQNGYWKIPSFPEITFGRLKQMQYIGKGPL